MRRLFLPPHGSFRVSPCSQIQNASMNISLDASFSSAITGGGGCSGVTPDRSVRAVMESGIRAAIPRNIVRDRARAIEGLPIMEGLEERGCSGARQGLESSLGVWCRACFI